MTQFSLPIIGIAGYSGSGKTTLVSRLIPLLRERGLRVGVLKHAHHNFSIDTPGKDSYQFRDAGANQVVVASKQRIAFVMERSEYGEPNLIESLTYFADHTLDIVIVEGFKRQAFSKIEVRRSGLKHPLLVANDPHIIAVATDDCRIAEVTVPILDLNNYAAIAEFIINCKDSGTLNFSFEGNE